MSFEYISGNVSDENINTTVMNVTTVTTTDHINLNDTTLQSVHSTPAKRSILGSDPEYKEETQIVNGGRKRGKINKRKEKQLERNRIKSEWSFTIDNACNHTKEEKKYNVCNKFDLLEEDIMSIRKLLSIIDLKVDQDKFILTMMVIQSPKRTDRRKKDRKERNTIIYYMPKKSGERIRVCVSAFSNITSFTKRRLTILANKFKEGNPSPKEIRGGARVNAQSQEVTESIMKFIQKFKNKKSHYARNDTGRSYLHPELSVKKMWEYWRNKRSNNGKSISSFGKFYNIFVNNLNLSFGHPKQDVCSFCTELNTKIKVEADEELKTTMKNNLIIHKENSKVFSRMLSTVEPGCINVCFDMIQNQPIPKLSVTDTFYSRQVWLYNLTFVVTSAENQSVESCYLYTWLETDSGRGPNEVCSAIFDFLERLENRLKNMTEPPTTLNLYSAQNKNQFVIALLLYYINCTETVFTKINHIFPVRGHSYMPPDQVFGRIEKCLRKKENIISPTEYYNVFKNFAQVYIVNRDFYIYDFKTLLKNIIKPNQFKTTEQKVFSYSKGSKTLGISQTYDGTPIQISILKRNVNLTVLNNKEKLPKLNHVKPLKQKDVQNLMRFFNVPDDAKEFYHDIFQPNELSTNENEETNEEGVSLYDENAIY